MSYGCVVDSDNQLACDVLRHHVPSVVVCHERDTGTSPGMHDVDLVLADGRTISVEVTRWADERSRKMLASRGQLLWTSDQFSDSWEVLTHPRAEDARRSVQALHHRLPAILSQLEASGRSRLKASIERVDPLGAELIRLNVREVRRLATGTGGRVSFTDMVHVSGDRYSIANIATEAAARPDNLNKLARSAGDERHLFVIVDYQHQGDSARLLDHRWEVPPPAPEVPDLLDVVWLLGLSMLWRFARQVGWEQRPRSGGNYARETSAPCDPPPGPFSAPQPCG